MTNNKNDDLWLEDLLKKEMPYIDDDGFTQKTLKGIETNNKTRRLVLFLVWLTCGSGLIYFIFNYNFNSPENKFGLFSQTLVQTLTTNPSLGVLATVSLVIFLVILTKTEV